MRQSLNHLKYLETIPILNALIERYFSLLKLIFGILRQKPSQSLSTTLGP